MELVSIIVPVYNVEKYLEACVDSIRRQTYSNLEIILVDDGSEDKSGDICEALAGEDTRIKVLRKKNGGASDARNKGVTCANGKYMLFCDGDDIIDLEFVEITVKKAEEHQCDLIYVDYKRVETNGEIAICSSTLPTERIINIQSNPELLIQNPSCCMKLYLREFYLKTEISFPVGYQYEDLGTIPRLLVHAKRIMYIKQPLYYYLIRGGSVTTGTNGKRNYNDRKAIIEYVIDYYKECQIYEKYKDELEFLTLFHMYFIPIREMIYWNGDCSFVSECRTYTEQLFPEYRKNLYIKRYLVKKEKLQLKIIHAKQYWMLNAFSSARVLLDKIKRK